MVPTCPIKTGLHIETNTKFFYKKNKTQIMACILPVKQLFFEFRGFYSDVTEPLCRTPLTLIQSLPICFWHSLCFSR